MAVKVAVEVEADDGKSMDGSGIDMVNSNYSNVCGSRCRCRLLQPKIKNSRAPEAEGPVESDGAQRPQEKEEMKSVTGNKG